MLRRGLAVSGFRHGRAAAIIGHHSGRASSMKRLVVCAAVALALSVAARAQPVPSPVSPSPVKRTMLGKVEVPGANYDVITAMVEIAPGFKAGRHNHPGTVQY